MRDPLIRITAVVMFLSSGQGLYAQLRLDGPSPFPRPLKIWNDTYSPREVSQALKNDASSEWLDWYHKSHGQDRLHETSIEFLGREQFFIKTPGEILLVNTSRMDENVLLVNRKAVSFKDSDKIDDLAMRMIQLPLRNSRSLAPLLFLMDYEKGRNWCREIAKSDSDRKAPVHRPFRRGLASLSGTSRESAIQIHTSARCRTQLQITGHKPIEKPRYSRK